MSKTRILQVLLRQEIRNALLAPALWGLLILLSLLVGYSFIQAVTLFSQASKTAFAYPELAAGMNPLEGIFVPVFGACYLVETLLLPFIILRLIGQDKQNGTLKLLLQLPLSTFSLNGVKLAAMAVVWLLFLIPAVSVIVWWQLLGGSVYYPELFTLILGHSLYSLTIISIAIFASAISKTLPTAAMLCLGATLGCWVLDFSISSTPGWMGLLSNWSLTSLLRTFESGLLSLQAVSSFLLISLLFFTAGSICLHPGRSLKQKAVVLLAVLGIFSLLAACAGQLAWSLDMTEDQSHSFAPADALALQQMEQQLTITVHLAREDGRFYDLNHEVLEKLQRVMPDLRIIIADTESTGLFAASTSDTYGLIEYEYGGKHRQSYSNSPLEILPLLHDLAGIQVRVDQTQTYGGHPLTANSESSKWWFYLLLPLLFLFAATVARQSQRVTIQHKKTT